MRCGSFHDPHPFPRGLPLAVARGAMSRNPYSAEAHVNDDEPVPVSGIDFAFADTVVALDLDLEEPAPVSGIVVSDGDGQAHQIVPVTYPPAAPHEPGVPTRVRFAWARVRHNVRDARDEMNLLWS